MNNLDVTQTIGSGVAANDGSVTIVDSSAPMIPPDGDENLQPADDDLLNWVEQIPLESFDMEDIDFPTHKEPDQLRNNASENILRNNFDATQTTGSEVAANAESVSIVDNCENNAPFSRRGAGLGASQLVPYHNYQKDMATTLRETADYLLQVQIQEQRLREEIKQLRQAMVILYQSIQNFRQGPLGTPSNMGVLTQLGGMGFRPPVHPSMNMPFLLQPNSPAAASSLFVPPLVPAPSQQQRICPDQTDDTQPTI